MDFKSKKFLIPIITIFILSIGLGGFIGRYIYTAKNIEVDIDYIEIIDSNVGGTILNPDVDIEMNLRGTVKSPTAINISVDSISYYLKIDGVDFGPGVVGSFKASKSPSPLIIHHNAENLGYDAGIVITNLLLGENVTIQINILTITMMGITFEVNSTSSFDVNIDNL
ncbi:MAG: hypothetical protein ACTSWX_12785 [Promethearchaeota archaeon]